MMRCSHHCRPLHHHRRGAVMMEFLLVLPIFALLFGGICVFGEMLAAKVRLQRAERLLVWNAVHTPAETLVARTRKSLWVEGEGGAGRRFTLEESGLKPMAAFESTPELPRVNRFLAERSGGIESYTLATLPGPTTAMLRLFETTRQGASQAQPLSQAGFTFVRPRDAQGQTAAHYLLSPNGSALSAALFPEEDPTLRDSAGFRFYYLQNILLKLLADHWPYLEAEGAAPTYTQSELPADNENEEELLKDHRLYERNPLLEPYTE